MYAKYTFSSNHNIHKGLYGLCCWASDPLIETFYKNLSIKGSEAQKQRPDKLLWMLWFDKKSIFNLVYLGSFKEPLIPRVKTLYIYLCGYPKAAPTINFLLLNSSYNQLIKS